MADEETTAWRRFGKGFRFWGVFIGLNRWGDRGGDEWA